MTTPRPEALTAANAPVIDDFVVDPTPAERRIWERAIIATLEALARLSAPTDGDGS